ncbi:helix-turn-helix domain-containing protein [Nonomuraea sp. NPDC050783]|uniref:helix-turn-helix domain-containing protein n=1 Tax=Nonomuraea sp. NPDC050783 TaxID=3154634 RepID=UPI003466B8B1
MGNLFGTLKRRVDANARRVVEACVGEIADYHAIEPVARASMMDFAVIIRRRTAELVASDEPLLDSDLAFIRAIGEQRGAQGVSAAGQRNALALHAALTMREIAEAAGPWDLDDTMHLLDWLSRHGRVAQAAHTGGYLVGQGRLVSAVARAQLLATMLLYDDPAAPELARGLGLPVCGRYLVTVMRVATGGGGGGVAVLAEEDREEVVRVLLEEHRVPVGWSGADEFVALVPCDGARDGTRDGARDGTRDGARDGIGDGTLGAGGDGGGRGGRPGTVQGVEAARRRALAIGRDFAATAGRSCAVGTADGPLYRLAPAAALARRVSRVAPVERVPRRAYAVADVFAELGAVQHPQVDEWLREVARRLAGGPDLVATLDAYYRNDMNRLLTAAQLHVHPRTLDYRLRRVRELVGLDPGSTRGVRVLSTAVTRLLAGSWPDDLPAGGR